MTRLLPDGFNMLHVRLSVMMFLEFFIWGAWYVMVAEYMVHHGMEDITYWAFTVNPIAAIVAPFFVGMIADRFFHSENVFSVLHLLAGAAILTVPQFNDRPVLFILLLLLHNLFYMPTINLSNTISFHNIANQEEDFPWIRMFGTIGWIVAGLVISFVLVRFAGEGTIPEHTPFPLYLAGGTSILLGLYGFTLPETPPPAAGEEVSVTQVLGVDALRKLGDWSFNVFLISTVLIAIPLAAYYNFTQTFLADAGFDRIAATQSIGQVSEVVFMMLMPLFFVRLGVKWMLAGGMLAWAARYLLFAFGAPASVTWMIIAGIALHGICYDFFFVAGQIYGDKKAPEDIKGQTQGLIIFMQYGIGMLVGAQVAGRVHSYILGDAAQLTPGEWKLFWVLPAVFAAVVFALFVLLFEDEVIEEDDPSEISV